MKVKDLKKMLADLPDDLDIQIAEWNSSEIKDDFEITLGQAKRVKKIFEARGVKHEYWETFYFVPDGESRSTWGEQYEVDVYKKQGMEVEDIRIGLI